MEIRHIPTSLETPLKYMAVSEPNIAPDAVYN